MCSGSKQKPTPTDSNSVMNEITETIKPDETSTNTISILLELSASDDLYRFKTAVEQDNLDIDEPTNWYARRIGSKKLAFENRTPLMVSATFGSKHVLSYILESNRADVNKTCGSDRATALHCAIAGRSSCSLDVVRLLLRAGADPNSLDINGNRPIDLISTNPKRKLLESILKNNGDFDFDECILNDLTIDEKSTTRKEYPVDLSLPDIKNGIYGTDDFRMYVFKVKPCSRAYSHDWTECPFVHPGENARRRDPRKYNYSCVPCPEFRKGMCKQGDICEYAHGIFECWLHPAQYRTRLCKDEGDCSRRVCFFAHKNEELRPLYASTGSGLPSPREFSSIISPFSPSLLIPSINKLQTGSGSREMDLDAELILLESYRLRKQQQLMDEISSLSSPSSWKDNNYRAAALNSRAAAFAKRSQSFIDRGTTTNLLSGISSNNAYVSNFPEWGSPDGKLDWGIRKDELNKLRKSASFGFRSSGSSRLAFADNDSAQNRQRNDGDLWLEQVYLEQEQMVA